MYKNRIKIGSITANYNSGKYFKDCLTGLLNQTVLPDIITFVDDGSTDDSLQQVERAMNDTLGIKHFKFYSINASGKEDFQYSGINFAFFKKANGGPSSARNVALDYLKNKVNVLAIADCDDIYYPKKIEKSLDIMLDNPAIGLVYTDYDTVNLSNNTSTREYKEPFCYERLLQECIVSNNSILSSHILEVVGKYDESLRGAEDYDLWLRLAEVSALYHIPEALYAYRMTGNNTTVTTHSQEFASYVNKAKQKVVMRRNTLAK